MSKSQKPSLQGVQQAEWDTGVKEEMVNIFRDTAEGLWARLIQYIGLSSTVAIFRSALRESGRSFPFLLRIKITNGGIRLDDLRRDLGGLERQTVRLGLLAFANGLVALLTELTGEILVHKVEPLVSAFRIRMDNF